MRGRGGGTSSSAVCREPPSRMSQRRNVMRDGVSTGQHQQDDRDDEEEASSSLLCVSLREKRRRQRENKLRTKDLSEEEMMDLALQLSEQEASVAALRLQREEEEDVMKAIEESMILHNHRPQSPSLLTDVEAPNRTCSRRKLSYSNGTSAVDEDETQLISGEKSSVSEVKRRQKKQKRKPGSPLLEMPDLSQTQTQNLDSGSAGGSEVVDLSQDSSQSSDSTLIDDSDPPKSPVFPSTCCQAEVLVPRLSQDLLESCRSSGFVLCSQDSHKSPKSGGAKSPTFPRSPKHSRGPPSQRNLVSSKPDQGHIRDRSPESCGSPGLCRPHGWTAGFTFSSQDSLTSSVVSTSCRSPVFPRTGPPSSEVSQTESGPVLQKTKPPQTSRSLKRNQDSDGAGRQGDQIEDVNDSPASGVKGAVRADSEEAELSSNMTLHWSDDDDDVTPVASPSPVFPAETDQDADPLEPTASNCRGHCSNTKPQPRSSHEAERGEGHPGACGSTVHYYWGVPFCPRGLDPDRYTQVIVKQMEVYEKSLKEAQRSLLRKAPWGEGIQPQPEQENSPSSESPAEASEDLPPQRRPRNKKWGNAANSPPAGAEEEEKEDGEEVEHRESQKEESRSRVGGGEQMETDDCEVPETQLSEDEQTQDVIVVRDVRAERRMKSAELPDVQMILQLESPAAQKKVEEEKEEVMEVDAPTVRYTEGNSPEGRSPTAGPARSDKEAETQDEQLLSATPSEQEVAVDVQEASVDCPICQGSFPASQIEMHAAYCDGTPVDSHRRREGGDSIPVSVRPRRKRRRGVEATDGESSLASNTSRKLEKCYICHLVVPVQDYNRHTELCIHRHSNASAAKENLLSALEKTDNRPSDVRPSGSRLQHGDVIDLRNDDDDVEVEEEEEEEGGGVSAIRISNSPIRSFTPISETTDCLIDFQRQHRSKKQGRRRR